MDDPTIHPLSERVATFLSEAKEECDGRETSVTDRSIIGYYVLKHAPTIITALRGYADAAGEIERLRSLHEPIKDTCSCQRCGRRDGMDAVVPNDVWRTITEGEWSNPDPQTRRGEVVDGKWNLLCLWCIDELCGEHGVSCRASLHFCGNHITAGSQSDADADHINRLCEERDALRAENARLSAALDEATPFMEALKRRHNGYNDDPENRKVFPRPPKTPFHAIDELVGTSESMGISYGKMQAQEEGAAAGERWIPVSEPPKHSDDVIVGHEGLKNSIVGYYHSGEWFRAFDDELMSRKPTHWQPLPEPPKESEVTNG